MQIKLIVSAAAIALAATVGSASAADRFDALEGIEAQAMTPLEIGAVIGGFDRVVVPPGPAVPTGGPMQPPDPPIIDDQAVGDVGGASTDGLTAAGSAITNLILAILP